jgi:hypothetical protein
MSDPTQPPDPPVNLFHENWELILKQSWAIRVALFWGAVSGLIAVWSAFEDVLPLSIYASLGVLMNASITVARLLKQPGTDLV